MTQPSPRIVYVNGDYLPETEAKVSVFDRGFLMADGVYEVTSVLGGKLIDFPGHIARLERFWQSVGMKTVRMTPDDHDRALAMTSHLPHVVAASLAATLSSENHSLTGSGFRDTTRVAAGDPSLWTGILLNNATHLIDGLEAMQHRLEAFRTAIQLGNADVLRQLLEEGKATREALEVLP